MRRLVNIVYGMMKNKTAYQPYSVTPPHGQVLQKTLDLVKQMG